AGLSSYRVIRSFPTRRSSDLVDFKAAADDSGVAEQLADFLFVVARHFLRIESVKHTSRYRARFFKIVSQLNPACAPSSTRNSNRSEEHTSELQSLRHLVCRLL